MNKLLFKYFKPNLGKKIFVLRSHFFYYFLSSLILQSESISNLGIFTGVLYNNNNNKVLVPKFWGWVWILNILVRVATCIVFFNSILLEFVK